MFHHTPVGSFISAMLVSLIDFGSIIFGIFHQIGHFLIVKLFHGVSICLIEVSPVHGQIWNKVNFFSMISFSELFSFQNLRQWHLLGCWTLQRRLFGHVFNFLDFSGIAPRRLGPINFLSILFNQIGTNFILYSLIILWRIIAKTTDSTNAQVINIQRTLVICAFYNFKCHLAVPHWLYWSLNFFIKRGKIL